MGQLLAKSDTRGQCWARIRLENGDLILVSVAQSGAKIFKLKWGGFLPGATLWAARSLADVGERFFNREKPYQRPLDSIIDRVIVAGSAAAVAADLADA